MSVLPLQYTNVGELADRIHLSVRIKGLRYIKAVFKIAGIKLLPYEGDDFWVEGIIFDAIKCLKSDKLPDSGGDCDFCKYREAVSQFEL